MLFCCFNKVGVGWTFDANFDSLWKKREMYLHTKTIVGKVPGPQHESRQWHQTLLTVIIFLTAMHSKQEKKSQLHLRMTLYFKSLQSCPTLCNPMDCKPIRLLCPWDSPSKNPGVGCHFLLQGIFPTQGQNPCSLKSSALVGGFFTTAPPEKPNNALREQ